MAGLPYSECKIEFLLRRVPNEMSGRPRALPRDVDTITFPRAQLNLQSSGPTDHIPGPANVSDSPPAGGLPETGILAVYKYPFEWAVGSVTDEL